MSYWAVFIEIGFKVVKAILDENNGRPKLCKGCSIEDAAFADDGNIPGVVGDFWGGNQRLLDMAEGQHSCQRYAKKK